MLVNITVPIFYFSDVDERTVLYQVQVSTAKRNWVLEKRYSQFKQLQASLKQYFPGLIPELPKKKYTTFFVGKSNEELEERRAGLEQFLREIAQHEQILNSAALHQFFDLVTPKLEIKELHTYIHGIRDFAFSKDRLFIVNAEMNALSRVDAYLQNMKLPWESEKGDQAIRPVGCLECWEGEKRVWIKTYNSQAICLFLSKQDLFVGLDSGSINYLHLTPQKFDQSFEIEQHTSRVMGIHYYKDLLHSVSKDHYYRVLNLKTEELVVDYEHVQELTCLKYCEVRECAFLGDRAGAILIMNNKGKAIAMLNTKLQFVRDLYLDNRRNYLLAIGYQSGRTVVFDVNKPGYETGVKEVTSFKNKNNSRCIAWSPSRGEVFIGDDDGILTIWSARDCSPIQEFKVHSEAITRLNWSEEGQRLMTASKDKSIKVITLPKEWAHVQSQAQEIQDLEEWYK